MGPVDRLDVYMVRQMYGQHVGMSHIPLDIVGIACVTNPGHVHF